MHRRRGCLFFRHYDQRGVRSALHSSSAIPRLTRNGGPTSPTYLGPRGRNASPAVKRTPVARHGQLVNRWRTPGGKRMDLAMKQMLR